MRHLFLILIAICFSSCAEDAISNSSIPDPTSAVGIDTIAPVGTTKLIPSKQRTGDAAKGKEYLMTGDYNESGIPLDFAYFTFGGTNLLNREGDNKNLSYQFNAVEAYNGEKVAAPNCLTCHADKLNGELIVGLGNTSSDYSDNLNVRNHLIRSAHQPNSPEMAAFAAFDKVTMLINDASIMPTRGINPGGHVMLELQAHRNLNKSQWTDEPAFTLPTEPVVADVPAWWLLKKKYAMYGSGGGRGDQARWAMITSILTLQDSDKLEEIDNRFPDIVAFIKTLEPPVYPKEIDFDQSIRGRDLFNLKCAKCHGTYGEKESYPNLLVDIDVVKTDPRNGSISNNVGFSNSIANSWEGQGENKIEAIFSNAYIAPPLDGIWATAPYLHNASIPTLEDLLNSEQRPTFWERSFDSKDIDYDKVGWQYTERTSKENSNTYDTTLEGCGNQGHYFGDNLSAQQRADLIEYLKTL